MAAVSGNRADDLRSVESTTSETLSVIEVSKERAEEAARQTGRICDSGRHA
jgi:hypothetical protein